MDLQNVSNLVIPEGSVRTIHDKNSRLLWGKLSYDTQYEGDSSQQTYTGKNIINFATINYSAANSGSGTRDGATYTVTATSDNTFSGVQFTQTNLQLKPGTTYTFSATVQSTTNSNGSVVFITSAMSAGGSNINGNYAKAGERTTATFTTPSSIPNNASIRLYPRAFDAIAVFTDIMVEENSAATNYEPYTGSSPTQIVPAPNPSYPQTVNVVTGEQTVTVSGKNLFDKSNVALGKNWGGAIGTVCYPFQDSENRAVVLIPVKPNTTYTLKLYSSEWYMLERNEVDSSYVVVARNQNVNQNEVTATITTTAQTNYVGVKFKYGSAGTTVFTPDLLNELKMQLEVGSTATTYEPYQLHSYTVNLGSTELCKIGNYQDYIYKSGDDWYVHKETGYIQLGSLTWQAGAGTGGTHYRMQSSGLQGIIVPPSSNSSVVLGFCSYYTLTTADKTYAYTEGFSASTTGNVHIYDQDYNTSSSTTDFTNWLQNNNVALHYALKTPTDTKITDNTLIGQLNIVHQFLTRYGYSATVSGNLPLIIDKTNL